MSKVIVRNLQKRYGDVLAADGVSFEIKGQEVRWQKWRLRIGFIHRGQPIDAQAAEVAAVARMQQPVRTALVVGGASGSGCSSGPRWTGQASRRSIREPRNHDTSGSSA